MNKKIVKRVLLAASVLYVVILVKLTFFKHMLAGIQYFPPPHVRLQSRFEMANFVPFRTIKEFFFLGDKIRFGLQGYTPAQQVEFVVQNLLGNIMMFVPLGLLLPCLFSMYRTFGRVSLACLGCSFLIEAAQFFSSRGYFDVDDIILNTVGGMLGYLLFSSIIVKAKCYRKYLAEADAPVAHDKRQ